MFGEIKQFFCICEVGSNSLRVGERYKGNFFLGDREWDPLANKRKISRIVKKVTNFHYNVCWIG